MAPSILASDFAKLGKEVIEAAQAGARVIHIDVMDGRFVPNISIGLPIVQALKPIANEYNLLLDVHLMIVEPERYIEAFHKAGADLLTVHIEASPHIHRTIQAIHDLDILAGVALNPGTPLSSIEEVLPMVDLALIMSVNPGFGGQSYIESATGKISRLARMIQASGSKAVIEVDGGIKSHNVAQVAAAGASLLVSGSGVFSSTSLVADNLNALNYAISMGNSNIV
ncbi:MAG: ribulose-phosphate 3-epimerase [Anaerolineae bacterium]